MKRLLVLALWPILADAEPLPPSAQSAMRSYADAVESARRRAITQLEQAQKAETQRGNLDGAVAIKAAIAQLSADADKGAVSLCDLPVKAQSVGHDELILAKPGARHQRRVVVDGQSCERFIYAHAPSRVVFAVPQGVRSFSAVCARASLDPDVAGEWRHIVKVDGREVFRSKPLSAYPNLQAPVSVDLPADAKELELIVDAMKDQRFDQSAWGNPVFR